MSLLTGNTEGSGASTKQEGANAGGSAGAGTITATGSASTSGNQTSWRESLAEELKNDPSLRDFHDIGALAKSYVETKKQIGKKGIIMPTDKDPPEAWTNFHKQRGMPESVDKYDLKLPEGATVNPEMLKALKESAFKSGIVPRELAGMLTSYLSFESEALKSQKAQKDQAVKEGIESLKKEFGGAFDVKIGRANEAILNSGIDGLQEWIDKRELSNDPMLIKLLIAHREATAEDTVTGSGASNARTPADIQSEINEILSNKGHPKHDAYRNPSHGSHKDVMRYVEGLYKQISSVSKS